MRLTAVAVAACLLLGPGPRPARAGEGAGLGPGLQQWDWLEVRPGARMFYWLYRTLADGPRPLVLWLQGGPGASSTGYGNFEELGVLDVGLNERNTTWVKEVNVAFIDNPVGTGFSHVDNCSLLASSNAEIATDLVTFTQLFLERNPAFADKPLYIFSESYGGKMAAEFALQLSAAVAAGRVRAQLRAVALGDGWLSPIDSVLTWAPFLLHAGVVDYEGYSKVAAAAESTRAAVEAGQWELATSRWSSAEGVVISVTADVDFYNILYKVPAGRRRALPPRPGSGRNPGVELYRRHLARSDADLFALMNGPVKAALGLPAGASWDSQSGAVWAALTGDFMRPATDIVERLLNETDVQVAVFSGQLDLIVDTPGTLDWVQRLRWPGAAAWRAARRRTLDVRGYVEGYVKSSGNLAFYWIDRAGHMVPTDNPYAGLEMLRRITKFDA